MRKMRALTVKMETLIDKDKQNLIRVVYCLILVVKYILLADIYLF